MTLVDTSAWVSFLRADGSPADRALSRLLQRQAPLHTTDAVVVELLAGAGSEASARRLSSLVASLVRCPPPTPIDLERAARLFRQAREAGQPVSAPAACLVAAIALRDDLDVLASHRDFEILADLAGLRVHGPDGQDAPEARDPRGSTAPSEASAAPEPPGAPARILVVEDEPSALRMLQDTLEGPHRTIVVATSGKEARQRIHEDTPDVIVLDLILPDEDGRTLLTDLRRHPASRDTGVVVVTGKAGPRTREECFGLGADAFFDKPFDAAALAAAVEHVVVEGRTTAPHPDPLSSPLTLSEVQKSLAARRGESDGGGPWTVALLELDTGAGGNGTPSEEERKGPDGHGGSVPLLPQLLRSTLRALSSRLADDELVARWGVDDLVVVSPTRDEAAMAELMTHLEALPTVSEYLTTRFRSVGRDEDLMDAVAGMGAGLVDRETQPGRDVATSAPPDSAAPAAPRGRPRAILVEDDPITAGLVRHRLERSGFVVEHHTDGAEALNAILASPPHVVILDVQLPSMDGFEILGRLREDPGVSETPVLMFTSLGRQEHVQRGFELGADDYVTKPFSPTELLTRVLRLVRRR